MTSVITVGHLQNCSEVQRCANMPYQLLVIPIVLLTHSMMVWTSQLLFHGKLIINIQIVLIMFVSTSVFNVRFDGLVL